jgi:Protein of unknown function (DUF3987)
MVRRHGQVFGRGAAKDRGFWLQCFHGGPYAVNRISRGAFLIENLSVSLLGGIQPDPIRTVAADTVDDGLLQRLIPIVLRRGQAERRASLAPLDFFLGVMRDPEAPFIFAPRRPE